MQSREVFNLFYYQERGIVISYNTMRVFSVLFCVFLVVSLVGALISFRIVKCFVVIVYITLHNNNLLLLGIENKRNKDHFDDFFE